MGLFPAGLTNSKVLVSASSGFDVQSSGFGTSVLSVLSVEAGFTRPLTSLRGSAQRVTSHPPVAMMKMKNSFEVAVFSANARRSGPPIAAAAPAPAPAPSTLRNLLRLCCFIAVSSVQVELGVSDHAVA